VSQVTKLKGKAPKADFGRRLLTALLALFKDSRHNAADLRVRLLANSYLINLLGSPKNASLLNKLLETGGCRQLTAAEIRHGYRVLGRTYEMPTAQVWDLAPVVTAILGTDWVVPVSALPPPTPMPLSPELLASFAAYNDMLKLGPSSSPHRRDRHGHEPRWNAGRWLACSCRSAAAEMSIRYCLPFSGCRRFVRCDVQASTVARPGLALAA